MTAEIPVKRKDPDEKLDYAFDWQDWLQTDDYIVSSEWTIEGDDTLDISVSPASSITQKDADAPANSLTRVWIENGTLRRKAKLTNTIITDGGRKAQASMFILMVAK